MTRFTKAQPSKDSLSAGRLFDLVTNRTNEPLELWRDYNGRATIEQRIEELKNDLATDDFCTQNFWPTEAAFLTVRFTFNLLSLWQQTTTPNTGYRQPATLLVVVFLCGAILDRSGRQAVLHLSAAWGDGTRRKSVSTRLSLLY